VNKSTLGIHEVKLVVQPGPSLGYGGGVGEHADAPGDLGQVTSWHHGRWLVVDANLKSSWTPVNKLDGPLGLDGGNGSIDILGHHISPVEHAAGHVLAVSRVALHHLVGRLKASVGDFTHSELLMVGLLSADDRGIHSKGEVDPERGSLLGFHDNK
jgi:hypothetical protein